MEKKSINSLLDTDKKVISIYNNILGKTEKGNVVIKKLFQKSGLVFARKINGIFSLRLNHTKYHFGNPFSSFINSQDLIKTNSTRESVEKYINWILNSKNNFYVGDISPEDNTVFVFGSNPEGIHGAGAAKVAKEQFGAIYGQGEGLQGNAYALPTKDLRVKENNRFRSISPLQIIENIKKLYKTAKDNPDKEFKIAFRNTVNKSLNGYTGLEMIEMFNRAGETPDNIVFSEEWKKTGLLRNSRAEWIRDILKSGDLKGKPIIYYKELGEPSHANALDYLINFYNWEKN